MFRNSLLWLPSLPFRAMTNPASLRDEKEPARIVRRFRHPNRPIQRQGGKGRAELHCGKGLGGGQSDGQKQGTPCWKDNEKARLHKGRKAEWVWIVKDRPRADCCHLPKFRLQIGLFVVICPAYETFEILVCTLPDVRLAVLSGYGQPTPPTPTRARPPPATKAPRTPRKWP